MPQINLNNVLYSYRRAGQGQPLLLLHGFTGSSRSWEAIITALDEHIDVIAVDLVGHGDTDSPTEPVRYALQRVGEDIVHLVQALGLTKCSLLGYSMGGRLALYLACRFPQLFQNLILESASPGIAGDSERRHRRDKDALLADQIESDGIESFVERWEKLPIFASQNSVPARKQAALKKQRLQNNPLGLANSLRGMGTGSQPSLWKSLPEIELPALLICGELDAKFVAINQKMSLAMPRARLHIVPQAGHNIHFEKPAFFSSTVLEFLSGGK